MLEPGTTIDPLIVFVPVLVKNVPLLPLRSNADEPVAAAPPPNVVVEVKIDEDENNLLGFDILYPYPEVISALTYILFAVPL